MGLKRSLSIYIHSIRAMRTVHWMFMVLLGFIIRPDSPPIIDFIIPAAAVAFVWQYTTMINDIHDLEIDRKAHPERALVRGEISVEEYRKMAGISLLLALGISVFAGPYVLLMNILFFALAILYSKPPIRIRNRWWGTAVMGSASSVELAAGYLSHYWLSDMNFLYTPHIVWLFPALVIIVFFALSIAPNITAYEDYDGDVEAGVSTIYTVLGKERGKKAVAFMLLFLFILPAILFPSMMNYSLSVVLGILAFLSFYGYACSKCVFSLYFLELVYFMAYFTGLIRF